MWTTIDRNAPGGKRPARPEETPRQPPKKKSGGNVTCERKLLEQAAAVANIEKLAKTADPDWQNVCIKLLETSKAQLRLLEELADQQRAIIAMLENQQPALSNKPPETPAKPKEEHSRSLVIAGLREHNGKPSERLRADEKAVERLLDQLDVEAAPVEVHRIPGPTNSTEPRLLKVVLQSQRQQRDALRNAKKLKSSEEHKATFVRPFMTKTEREVDFRLRRAAKLLREQGKSQVRISKGRLYVANVECDPESIQTSRPKQLDPEQEEAKREFIRLLAEKHMLDEEQKKRLDEYANKYR